MANEISVDDVLKSPQQDSGGGNSFTAPTPTPSPGIPGVSVDDVLGTPASSSGFQQHDESDRFSQPDDPNDNWLEKGWKWASEKPLTETLFGWGRYRQGAGGLERGAEKLLTGMTTPLSLGLLAAFAPAGFIEGAAGSALKEGLTGGAESLGGEAITGLGAASKVESYAKAVDAARKAQIAGKPIEQAVADSTGGSLGYQEFLNYGKYLRGQGLAEDDILGEGLARRVASLGLRKAGLDAGKAQAIAKGAEGLVNLGFGVQQVHGAIYAYPRVADLLSKGNYDEAAEYMVEAGAGTVFGALGLAGGFHSVAGLVPGINEAANLPLSDATEALKYQAGLTDAEKVSAQVKNQQRSMSQQAMMMDSAGLGVPAQLRPDANFAQDVGSSVKEIFRTPAQKEQLDHEQRVMNAAVETGNDQDLSFQTQKALAYAFHLEDYGDKLLEGVGLPTRTVESIANEEKNDILRARADRQINGDKLSTVTGQLNTLQHFLGIAEPEQLEEIQKQIETLSQQKDTLELRQRQLKKEYDISKEWEKPDEGTYLRHYERLNNALNEASKTSKNVNEFNEKVRALGNYPQDIAIIEAKYPHFRRMEDTPIVQDEVEYNPASRIFSAGSSSEEITLAKKAVEDANARREEAEKENEDAFQKFGYDSDEYRRTDLEAKKAARVYISKVDSYDLLSSQKVGEVHQLPSGHKISYLSPQMYKKVNELLGDPRSSRGQVLAYDTVRYLKAKLSIADFPQKNDLMELIDKGQSPTGELVMAQHNIGGGQISQRMGTAREELVHGWQHSLAQSFSRHLNTQALDRLMKTMPEGMQKHLKAYGYERQRLSWVLESAAKMMSKDADTLSITKQQQAKWLHEYFKEVKAEHGDKAFDNLVHTTTRARQLKEEFLNGIGSERPSGTGASPEALAGVGAGGRGGNSGAPPEPPGPPEEEYEFQHDPDWRKKFPPSTINGGSTEGFPIAPWQTGPQHRALPADLVQKVEKTRAKPLNKNHQEYVKKQLAAYAEVAKGLNPKRKALYDSLRKADDDNWTVGYNHDLIHSIVNNHLHHIWGEKDDFGNTVRQEALSGAFSTNVMQARHRTYGTALEGFLQGRQLQVHDPVRIIELDANALAEAAAHKNFIARVLGKKDTLGVQHPGIKDPEGMPAFVTKGQGSVVPGEDGTSSALLVNPEKVRNIHMSPEEVAELERSGLLKTFIKDGRVSDQTPKVNQDNAKAWIEAIGGRDGKISKLLTLNPLLAEKQIHEKGWASIQDFATTQARKIADFLGNALKQIEQKGTTNGVYEPLSSDLKPQDFAMSPYLKSVLFGEARGKITPGDLQRLKDYASRNWKYTLGESSFRQRGIRPGEISRLLHQERQFLPPELKAYIDKNHDIFATDARGNVQRTPEGDWTKTGLTTALKYIHHAATDPVYPQLVRDLSDLKYVDNVLTSEPNTLIKPWKESDPTPTLNPITHAQQRAEAESRLADINSRQERKYLWAPKSHITIDHPAFHGWNWMANAADGTPTLAKSDIGVSRHFYKYVVNRLGLEPSWLRKDEGIGKLTGPLLKAGAQAKSAILSGSPFHIIQEGLRALMLHTNPFVRPNPIANLDETFQSVRGPKQLLRLGVENGLTVFSNRKEAEDFSTGVASHGGIVAKIPIYGPITDQIHDLLFNRLIPTYKANGFRKMFDKYAEAHPDWEDSAVARHAAEHVNNAFGGQNWREMGRSSTTQDWFNLVALAPDWLESEMRFAAGLFRGYGIGPAQFDPGHGKNISRMQVAQAAAVLWTSARVLNLLYSGNAHYETPFGFATKDKTGREIEFSVRTLPTDILHMATDPSGFLMGRESPLVRTGAELYTGRNQYGQKLTDGEKYVDLLSNLVPIWGQAGLKQVTHLATSADVPGWAQVVKAGGATASVYRTPAQKTAANLASERSEEGSMNPAKIVRHRMLLQLEDSLRNGQIKPEDVTRMVDEGQLPQADAKASLKNAKETALLDPEQARMYSRVSRLDFAGADAVYKDSNPEEKQTLEKLIRKKAKSYIKKSLTDETPVSRAADPMYKRARQYVPLEGSSD